jgi:hypothetical protein
MDQNASDIVKLSILVAALHRTIGEIRGDGKLVHHTEMAAMDCLTAWPEAAAVLVHRAGKENRAELKRRGAKIKAGLAA